MIRHRTFLRFVAMSMLLALACLLGIAYSPVQDQGPDHAPDHALSSMLTADIGAIKPEAPKVSEASEAPGPQLHRCDKTQTHQMTGDDVRCATGCSYFLAPELFAFAPSGQRFNMSQSSLIWMGEQNTLLRPPIA